MGKPTQVVVILPLLTRLGVRTVAHRLQTLTCYLLK